MKTRVIYLLPLIVLCLIQCKKPQIEPVEQPQEIRSGRIPATCNGPIMNYLSGRCSATDFANLDIENAHVYSIDSGKVFVFRIPINRRNPQTDFLLLAMDQSESMFKGNYVHIDAAGDWETDSTLNGHITFQSLGRDTTEVIDVANGVRVTNLTNTKLIRPVNPSDMPNEVFRVKLGKGSPGVSVGVWMNFLSWLDLGGFGIPHLGDGNGIFGYYGGGGGFPSGGPLFCGSGTIPTIWGSFPEGNTDVNFAEEYPVTQEILDFYQDYRAQMTEQELQIFDNELSFNQQIAYLDNARLALSFGQQIAPLEVHNGRGDAARHTYFVILNCRALGEDLAWRLAAAHETAPGQPAIEFQMDTHNNSEGLAAFAWIKSVGRNNSFLKEFAMLYIRNRLIPQGRLRVIVNGVLVPSFQ